MVNKEDNMIGVFKHKKTGNLYSAERFLTIKILWFWVRLVEYKNYDLLENTYYIRTVKSFNRAFSKATIKDFER
jgi:hypothetical protein